MINHSPAQLIAELRRLMDMDYEQLPGARHVLEEAIAAIRPLAEKSDVGEMIDPLRALLSKWACPHHQPCPGCSCHFGIAARCDTCAAFNKFKAELDALLSAPVGSLPSTVSIVRCEHGGVQIEGHTALGDWELELDACGDIIEIDKGSAPVPVGSGWQPIETAPTDGRWFLAWDRDCEYTIQRRGHGFISAEEPDASHWMPLPSAPGSAPVGSPPPPQEQVLDLIDRQLAWMDRASFMVDLQYVTSKKHSGGMAVVVDHSDAMHALLFVRQALRSAPRGGGETR
jgi:hypothetical protein